MVRTSWDWGLPNQNQPTRGSSQSKLSLAVTTARTNARSSVRARNAIRRIKARPKLTTERTARA